MIKLKGYSKSDPESYEPKYRFLKSFQKNDEKFERDTRDCYRKANDKGKIPCNKGHTYHASQEVACDQEDESVGTYHKDHYSDDGNEESFISLMAFTQCSCSPTSTRILDT